MIGAAPALEVSSARELDSHTMAHNHTIEVHKNADQVLTLVTPFKNESVRAARSGVSRTGRPSKSDRRYWEAAVFKRKRRRATGLFESSNFRIQLQSGGRRVEFDLATPNRNAAGRFAREISDHLRVNGWEATLARYKPGTREPQQRESGVTDTVGQFLTQLHDTQPPSRSLAHYSRAFRQIVRESLFGFDTDPGKAKYNYRSGGRDAWLAKIDAVRLSDVTPALIQRWRIAYLSRALSPTAQRAAKISVNSTLRQAASLFAPKRLEFISLQKGYRSPFAGVKLEPRQSCRYRTSFDVRALLTSAREELAPADPEAYKVFLLGLCCGLRRGEIDKLTWAAFDWEAHKLYIEPTEHFAAKTQDSIGSVDLEPGVVAIFKSFRGNAPEHSFVIEAHTPGAARKKKSRDYYGYRAQKVFRRLSAWLRLHGLRTLRPIHLLRKEYGSRVCDKHGIYAASMALRHANIAITAAHYVDKRSRATPGLGELL
jgi:integrase